VKTDEGDIYYHNHETDETAWELPPGGEVKKAEDMQPAPAQQTAAEAPTSYWMAVQTPDGETYYHNEETGDTAWELPPGGKIVQTDTSPLAQPAGEAAESQGKPTDMSWAAVQTAEGQVYYYNQRTGETAWELPADVLCSPTAGARAAAAQATAANDPWAGMYQAQAAEEAARQQREAYQAAMQQAQAAEEAARLQREQWDQMYAHHWAWFQHQQQAQQAQQQAHQAGAAQPQEAAAGLVPPGLDATMEEQIAFAMKCNVVQEMEEMLKQGSSLAQRKKALKMWQIKWHPDKNPDQAEVAKSMFQFIGEKRSWFLHDTDPDGLGNWEDLPVDMPD